MTTTQLDDVALLYIFFAEENNWRQKCKLSFILLTDFTSSSVSFFFFPFSFFGAKTMFYHCATPLRHLVISGKAKLVLEPGNSNKWKSQFLSHSIINIYVKIKLELIALYLYFTSDIKKN